MQVAVDVAGFSPAEADELRRAMGAKRSTERMERLRGRFYAGMAANGIEGELADKIFDRMLAFANFGFPESHSISFASLVYYSAWFKLYHPSAFCAALLQRPADGLLLPAVAGGRRPPARGAGARPGRQPRRSPGRAAAGRAQRRRAGGPAGDDRHPQRRREARRADRGGAHARRPLPRTWPTWRAASGSPSPRPRRWPRPGRSGRSGGPAGGAVGGGGGRRGAAGAACRAPPSASTHRRCRG